MMYVVGQQPCLIASAARSGVKPLHTPSMVSLLIHVAVPAAACDQVWTLVVHMSSKGAIDSPGSSIMERFLQAVPMHPRITSNSQQPLIRVSVVYDVASFRANIWPNACAPYAHAYRIDYIS